MINVHGTGVVLDGFGVLLRGRSGAGKSLLALQLLDTWRDRGRGACLVSDDRIEIDVETNRLFMSAPPTIAGLIELRGRGIVSRESCGRAPLDLVIDMTEELIRFLEEEAFKTEIEGIGLARCPVPERGVIDSAHQILLVAEALKELATPDKADLVRQRRSSPKKGLET